MMGRNRKKGERHNTRRNRSLDVLSPSGFSRRKRVQMAGSVILGLTGIPGAFVVVQGALQLCNSGSWSTRELTGQEKQMTQGCKYALFISLPWDQDTKGKQLLPVGKELPSNSGIRFSELLMFQDP